MKKCNVCSEEKLETEFYSRRQSPDGLDYSCKDCRKAQAKKSQENHPDKRAAYKSAWQRNNPEKRKETKKKWRDENRELVRKINRDYVHNNPGKVNANTRKRQAAKLNATPTWLTPEQIAEMRDIYILAKQLEAKDGIPRHVDHIIPLQGDNVSGLHVPCNLQILTADENIKKSNL